MANGDCVPDSLVDGYFSIAEKEGCPHCGGPLGYDCERDITYCKKCEAIIE
jgi:hypothetical protein